MSTENVTETVEKKRRGPKPKKQILGNVTDIPSTPELDAIAPKRGYHYRLDNDESGEWIPGKGLKKSECKEAGGITIIGNGSELGLEWYRKFGVPIKRVVFNSTQK